MKARQFDRRFDAGEDVSKYLDIICGCSANLFDPRITRIPPVQSTRFSFGQFMQFYAAESAGGMISQAMM
jgi:hypothetical protein